MITIFSIVTVFSLINKSYSPCIFFVIFFLSLESLIVCITFSMTENAHQKNQLNTSWSFKLSGYRRHNMKDSTKYFRVTAFCIVAHCVLLTCFAFWTRWNVAQCSFLCLIHPDGMLSLMCGKIELRAKGNHWRVRREKLLPCRQRVKWRRKRVRWSTLRVAVANKNRILLFAALRRD